MLKLFLLTLIVSITVPLYLRTYLPAHPTAYTEPNYSATNNELEKSEIEPGLEIDHTMTAEAVLDLLDEDGTLTFNGWAKQNKVGINKTQLNTDIWGVPHLGQWQFKQWDEIHININGWKIELVGMLAGTNIHFGVLRLSMYNWKSGAYHVHQSYICPWDTYIFQDDTYFSGTRHFKSGGLEAKIAKGNGGMVGLTLSSELLDLDFYLLAKGGKQGALHTSQLDASGKYWLKSWRTSNEPVKAGQFTYKGDEYKPKNEEYLSDSDMIFSTSIKGHFPFKKVPFVVANFETVLKGETLLSMAYESAYPAEDAANDLTQYMWVEGNMSKLEPLEVKMPALGADVTKEVEFCTKDIEKYQYNIVKLKFQPFEEPKPFFSDNNLIDLSGSTVYGVFNGWVVDSEGNTWYIKNAKGYMRYGTLLA